jgi:hypothetical protein
MVEAAADRFLRRGLASMAVPAELADRLKRDLTTSSKREGSLTVELRGKGAERTERDLDTFVTALVSVANAARSARADGLATLIAQSAHAGHDPVEDPRPTYALGLAGGGLLACGLLGFMVWSRLSRAKHRYEEEQKIGEVIGDLSWGEPPVARSNA